MSNPDVFSAIQFIGTQRSGSNLLRVMLNQLPEISAPHPPHILKTFFPLLPPYGDLSIDNNFYSLTKDICEWVNINPVPWEGVQLNADHVISKCTSHTLIEIFRRIYELKAAADGARYWCCKSMESVKYVNELESTDIKPYYIHIYRDGRDVAISFLKAIVGPKHIYHLAKKWYEEQDLSLEFQKKVPAERFISVKYEELIERPKVVMKDICNVLGVKYQEDVIMDYFHSKESLNTANSGEMWKNVAKPILKDNHHKYLRELTTQQIEIFERVAGDMLDRLGYERLIKSNSLVIKPEDIKEFDSENEVRIEQSLQMADHEDVVKRRPQQNLYLKITSQGDRL